jgi:hypothetical protein
MGTLQQRKELRGAMRPKLEEVVKSDPEDLARIRELGTELNFAECIPSLKATINLFRDVAETLDAEELSFNALSNVSGALDATRNLFRSFVTFSVAQSNPPNRNILQERNNLIQQGLNHYDNVFGQVSPVIAFCAAKRGRMGELESQAEGTLNSMKSAVADLESSRDEAKKTLEIVKGLAQRAGVSQHAEIFAEEAKSHQSAAWLWLLTTVALTGITVWAGFHFYQVALQPIDPSKPYAPTQPLQAAVAKIALLSILFTATIWVGKMYRSHRHNAVVNKHRSNALRTFETFAKATSDDSTKNAVLIKATECIFSPQQTGYTSHEPETGGVAQVVEIVRGIAGKNG